VTLDTIVADRNIEAGEGFKVVAIKPKFQNIQTFGYTPPRKTYQRKQAYDGGPWINIEKEVAPASNTITQKRLVAPWLF